VRDFAGRLPNEVFAEVFGVDDADRERFIRWSANIVDLGAPMEEERSVALAEEYVEFQRYLARRIETCPAGGGDDVISHMVNGERPLTRPEFMGICALLLAAGSDPTTATLTALLHRIVAEPGLMAAVRADRALIPAVIDETLRLESPVAMFQRTATRDTEIRGQQIKRGEHVMVIYASANRDPGHWESPDEFRLGRPNIKDHLAFTQGPHNCVGAHLGRAMVRIGAEVVLDCLASIELDGGRPLEFRPELMTRAYRELPLIVSGRDGRAS
jgi:cytochrome P450